MKKRLWEPYPLTPYQRSLQGIKLHLGCNIIYLNDWINIDIDSKLADIKANVIKLEMFDDNTVELILASHIIEHFDYTKHTQVLKEWHRVLKPYGELIIECPDFEKSAKNWLKQKTIKDRLVCSPEIFGRGDWNMYQVHQSGIWPDYLNDLLEKVGFEVTTPMVATHNKSDVCMRIDARKRK